MTTTSIAAHLQRSRITVRKYLSAEGYEAGNTFYSNSEKREMQQLFEEGHSCQEISRITGKSANGINHYLKSAGIDVSRKDNISDEEKAIAIKVFQETGSCAKAALACGRSKDGVWSMLKREGFATQKDLASRLSSDKISLVKAMYEEGHTAKEILPFVNDDGIHSEKTIINLLERENIKIRNRGYRNIILHEDLFDSVENQETAYLIGFMLSDGFVLDKTRNRSPCWGIMINSDDEYILERFRELVGVKNGIYQTPQRNESRLVISSRHMVQELSKYNVVPRKSLTTSFPFEKIPSEMYRHVVRGIFDGDGCIYKSSCTFYGKSQLVSDIRTILCSEIGTNPNPVFVKKDGVMMYSFSSKKDVSAFYHYLYDGATLFLTRKKQKFENLPFIIN